ncbi:CPBP family intramembrane glutamic endopeptidase [Phenylobacterium montanum]|uniref:CPBP family intramembrane metalloprotease n=1 Tax=Phenylobacterium montanum TaxID=2823693 RepID=A0A975IVH3_9CAUL|nr:CPBP family intramembrane glutamic endopeptidase [Caulobacter sp. S6]QUD88574.1 CPBP family intramembrane metalloprotease [Caulobacter sp. S6]
MSFSTYAARGKNAVWRYLVAVPLAMLLSVVIGVIVLLPLTLAHLLPPDFTQQAQHPTNPGAFFAFTGATFAAFLAGFASAAWLLHRKSIGDLVGDWRWSAWARGFGLWGLLLLTGSLIDFVVAPRGFSITANSQTPMLAAAAVPALMVQTFAEEFVFRGYVTQALLLATRRPVVTAILSGLVFGSVHIPNGWPEAANAVIFGVVLALIAIRTGGLAFGWGIHLVNNLYGAVVVVSGGDVFHGSPGLFTQATPHLMWLDVLVATAMLGLVAALVWRGRIVGPPQPEMVSAFD